MTNQNYRHPNCRYIPGGDIRIVGGGIGGEAIPGGGIGGGIPLAGGGIGGGIISNGGIGDGGGIPSISGEDMWGMCIGRVIVLCGTTRWGVIRDTTIRVGAA